MTDKINQLKKDLGNDFGILVLAPSVFLVLVAIIVIIVIYVI